ncbi:MAG: GatB/YqeY domain-containing protein [Chloroflexota bacterium]
MTLKDQLMNDLKDAMRSGDELRRETIRMARSAVKNAEINRMGELDDAGVQDVLRKEIKQRRESAEEYTKGKRPELAEKELAEVALLEAYLPQQMSPEEIETEVRGIIAEVGSKEMSKVMPAVMKSLKGRADGRLVNQIVTRVLAE